MLGGFEIWLEQLVDVGKVIWSNESSVTIFLISGCLYVWCKLREWQRIFTLILWWSICILMGVVSYRNTLTPPTGHEGSLGGFMSMRKEGFLFRKSLCHPSSRVPEIYIIYPKAHWSCLARGGPTPNEDILRWYSFTSVDKATHPTNRQEDWEYIIGFCDQINKELEGYVCGTANKLKTLSPTFDEHVADFKLVSRLDFSCSPQIAVTLIVHKIHSPQEWEALQALTVRNASTSGCWCSQTHLDSLWNICFCVQVLEACMKNCGKRFHNEVAKYRFLNELIKVVSPKVSRQNRNLYNFAFEFMSCYPISLTSLLVSSTWATACPKRWSQRSLRWCTAGRWLFPTRPRSAKPTRRWEDRVCVLRWGRNAAISLSSVRLHGSYDGCGKRFYHS